jgi:DNA-binding response OmpR family regulator
LRVLIVDDDPTVLDATARIVEGWGASVSRAHNLAAAKVVLEAGLPHRLLVDYSLPDGIGSDLARSWQAATGSRAVVITGEALLEDARELLVVRKPLTALKLRTALESVARPLSEPAPG